MDIEPLQIKNKYYYDCKDIIIYDFDIMIMILLYWIQARY